MIFKKTELKWRLPKKKKEEFFVSEFNRVRIECWIAMIYKV